MPWMLLSFYVDEDGVGEPKIQGAKCPSPGELPDAFKDGVLEKPACVTYARKSIWTRWKVTRSL